MDRDWQKDLTIPGPSATALLPPAMMEETGWDILLALHADGRRKLSLKKLASIVSVRPRAMGYWLGLLEDRRLVAAVKDEFTGELRAVLTSAGRELLDHYLSAISGLQAGAH